MDRGVIRNHEYAAQIRDFSGLRWGTITPTDIDGCIDWHNRLWVLLEFKHSGAELPFGQRLALERQCDDLQDCKPTLLVVASHEAPPEQDIDAANAIVTEYRYKGEWLTRRSGCTVRALLDTFFDWMDR